MKKPQEGWILGKMLKKIAPKIGAKVLLEPKWNIVGQITFKSGKKSYFRYNTLDLNPVGASDISKDKDYANFFLKSLKYPIVPNSRAFYADWWCKAIDAPDRNIHRAFSYAQKIGFPVIVKPNGGSQGVGVALVRNKQEFYRALKTIFEQSDKIALVQKKVSGRDYRIVVLDNKIISAYERIPLNVIGNNRSTILDLLKTKQKRFVASSRDTQIKIKDPRIKEKLKSQGLTFKSIPKKGQQIFLLDNANLSTGGDSIDVTNLVHSDFKKIAVNVTRDMGMRICGVDLMIQGDISQKPSTWWILETNAAPGLDHYVKIGKSQEKIVEEMYLEVLKAIDK